MALRGAVGTYCPLGFHATCAYVSATAGPVPDLRRDPTALLRALGTLEESRAVHLAEMDGFAARRRLEKTAGRRSPRPSDTATLRGPRWPSSAPPSRLGLIAAVANRHSALQRIPRLDETLAPDIQIRQLADLLARLGGCASSYRETLGRLDRSAAEELAEIVRSIDGLARPGYSPVNLYLLPWLRFAKLLTVSPTTGCDPWGTRQHGDSRRSAFAGLRDEVVPSRGHPLPCRRLPAHAERRLVNPVEPPSREQRESRGRRPGGGTSESRRQNGGYGDVLDAFQ